MDAMDSCATHLPRPGAKRPKHLDGSLAGDYGFDPLRLGVKPELLAYYREGELTNGRWCASL